MTVRYSVSSKRENLKPPKIIFCLIMTYNEFDKVLSKRSLISLVHFKVRQSDDP